MIEFGQYIVNGISQGCVYVLLASGLTIILGILNVPNFAHGHLYMVAAYVVFYLVMSSLTAYWAAIILAMIVLGILGLIIYWTIFYPIRKDPEVNFFVAAMGLLMLLEGAAFALVGTETKYFIIPATREVISFGGLALQVQRLIVIIGTVVVMIILEWFIKKTTLGAALEATAQNREGALLCGIKVGRLASIAFVIGTALAGIAGALIGPAVLITPSMGAGPLMVAFSAVVFGGLGSLRGAVIGALLLGLVESLASGYLSAAYSLVFVFGAMIIMLLIRPRGLLGKEVWRP
jgi:branched-chain amino acid transport system permease protein